MSCEIGFRVIEPPPAAAVGPLVVGRIMSTEDVRAASRRVTWRMMLFASEPGK
ncbi:hypothetical protein OU415_29525 [Saccharopolyspora sp. WRP15-2]|uniref:Uncharacterized protein n=1 Tax=Saccharopolyspora oryzae TaxID=2997343 RepID=A0ABT4V6K0_9PSEU|nr:hypothetical protein [Saccharopolyspora oryzae]MDA3629601.1 hypothetical protein [Saccharopolyspora oryzae]